MQQLVGYTEKINEDKEKRSHMNKLVICSIHQPSSEVFACFSHVILMQEGRIAFQGTVLEAENFFSRFLNNGLNEYSIIILEYFVSYGFICPPAFNRADFFVNKLSVKTYDINHNISTNHRKAATSSTVENIEMCYTKAKCSNYELSKRCLKQILYTPKYFKLAFQTCFLDVPSVHAYPHANSGFSPQHKRIYLQNYHIHCKKTLFYLPLVLINEYRFR